MNKKIILMISLLIISLSVFSQNEVDAFRFSQAYYSGTARSMAMGNAFGALGGDYTVASTNPAGLGVFKHSSFSISPALYMNQTASDFNGSVTNNDKLSLTLNNIGAMFSINNKIGKVKTINFGIGYNTHNHYTSNIHIKGVNNKGSMLDALMLEANGKKPNDLNNFTSFRAWDTYLLDTLPGSSNYTNPLWWSLPANQTPQYGQTQKQSIEVKGSAGELFLSSAVNINNFLYIGGTIGFQKFSYHQHSLYTENNFNDNDSIKSFSKNETITDDGDGVNFKIGFLLMPADFIRIGGAIHTSTVYKVHDRFNTSMESHWVHPDPNGNYDYLSKSPVNDFDYTLHTPARYMGNIGFIISNIAIIGIDYEYVDYGKMSLSSSSYMFSEENSAIKEHFKGTHNVKAGVELRYGIMSFRAGYAYFGNPYTDGRVFNKSQISGGIGFSAGNIFLDFAYVHDINKYKTHLYNGYKDEPVPEITSTTGIINITTGIRF